MRVFQVVFLILTAALFLTFAPPSKLSDQPVVTAEKYLAHKMKNYEYSAQDIPKIVLICYSGALAKAVLEGHQDVKSSPYLSSLHLIQDGQIGVLEAGIGAPALMIKLEQLLALGVKRYIAVGTAGALDERLKVGDFAMGQTALTEDGVSDHYLTKKKRFVSADSNLSSHFDRYAKSHSQPEVHPVAAWSFPAIFKESSQEIRRVKREGCQVVEMEAAALYAFGEVKGCETLSLFVISDLLSEKEWDPHLRDPLVSENLQQLAKLALHFCQEKLL